MIDRGGSANRFNQLLVRLPKFFLVAALSCSVGLPWAALQSIAWLGMLLTYSQEAPLTEAVVRTFDGKHPCALCKEIAKNKHSEKKEASNLAVQKFEFSYVTVAYVFSHPMAFWEMEWPQIGSGLLRHSPPVPPPRPNPR
jgi:hypothetical protein